MVKTVIKKSQIQYVRQPCNHTRDMKIPAVTAKTLPAKYKVTYRLNGVLVLHVFVTGNVW